MYTSIAQKTTLLIVPPKFKAHTIHFHGSHSIPFENNKTVSVIILLPSHKEDTDLTHSLSVLLETENNR